MKVRFFKNPTFIGLIDRDLGSYLCHVERQISSQLKLIIAMKKIFLLLLSTTLFFACEKDKDKNPAPELAAQVAGSYKVTKLEVDGQDYPLTRASVIIQIEKFSAEVITGKMKVKIDGVSEPDEDLGTLNLKNAGSTGIDIYEGTEKVGNLDKSNKLTIFVVFEGQDFEMVAERQ
jgi:hypothetical protein